MSKGAKDAVLRNFLAEQSVFLFPDIYLWLSQSTFGITKIARASSAKKLCDRPFFRALDALAEYRTLDARREEVLEAIAETAATGPTGIAAKARVLQTTVVAEIFEDTGAIAASLAEDILRLHPVAVSA